MHIYVCGAPEIEVPFDQPRPAIIMRSTRGFNESTHKETHLIVT